MPGAVLLARALGVPIRLVMVQSPRVDALEAITMLETACAELDAPSLAPVVLEDDDVARALLDHVAGDGRALLCMSSHGRTGLVRAFLGSTTAAVLTHATVPVVVIGPLAEPKAELDLVEVVVDGAGADGDRLVAAAHDLIGRDARFDVVDAPSSVDAALVVVSGGGPSVFGSVAEQVVHRAPCPVLVVPPARLGG